MGSVDLTLTETFVEEDGRETCGYKYDEVTGVSLNAKNGVLFIEDDDKIIVIPWRLVANIEMKDVGMSFDY